MKGLLGTLPCKACRDNLPKRLEEVGYTVDDHARNDCYKSRDAYTRFVFRVHDSVNKALNKPPSDFPVDYRARVEYYEQFRAQTCSAIEEVACRGPLNVKLTIGGGAKLGKRKRQEIVDLTTESSEEENEDVYHVAFEYEGVEDPRVAARTGLAYIRSLL